MNRPRLIPTVFIHEDDAGVVVKKYGFRAYDDFRSVFDDNMTEQQMNDISYFYARKLLEDEGFTTWRGYFFKDNYYKEDF